MNRLPTISLFATTILWFCIGNNAIGIQAKQTPPIVAPRKNSVTINKLDGGFRVGIGDQHFTTLDYQSYDKPILYPIFGPDQRSMTRNWPMRDDVPGEEHDHRHHKSMWLAHTINDIDFWTEKHGFIETQSAILLPKTSNAIQTKSNWLDRRDHRTVLTDTTVYRFGAQSDYRWIDVSVTFHASHGDVVFEDTKEGLFAIRTHPDLRLTAKPESGVNEVFGKAINSNGVAGKKIWGKPAKWVLYSGQVDHVKTSIAMFDHPTNLRHPTTWHARDYGLIAANPFGAHYFSKSKKGAGRYRISDGESLTLRYRVLFVSGNPDKDWVSERFSEFASD